MIYFVLLIPPILYALSNLIDKHLVHGDEDESSAEMLVFIGAVFNLLIAGIFLIYFFATGTSFHLNIPLLLNGLIFTVAIWIYLKLLFYDDVERIAPWYQSIPIFGLIGGIFFLNEIPSLIQVFGIFAIVFGGLLLSIKKGRIDKKIIFGMLVSSLLITINDVLLAYFGRDLTVGDALFSDVMGKVIFGGLCILFPFVYKNAINAIKNKLAIQSVNEIIFIVADLVLDYGKLILPVVLVQVTASTQPLFLLLGIFLVTKYKPDFLGQNDLQTDLKKKVLGIIVVVVGGVLIFI
jgi:uncharacterized membrane protein